MENKIKDTMTSLLRINRKLFTANESSEKFLIGRGQMNILKEIIDNQNINQDQLADNLNLDKTTIAKAVKRLESKGLIIRKKSEIDRRKNELIATEKAFVIKDEMAKHISEYSNAFFEGIGEKEIDSFKKTLDTIESNIERKKTMKNEKKHKLMEVIQLLTDGENVDINKLATLLEKDSKKVQKKVEKLISKGVLEEREGFLFLTDNFKDHFIEKQNRKGDVGIPKDKKNKIKAFKMIVKNNGLTKEELIEQFELDPDEVDSHIKHLEKKGVIEIKDGRIFVNEAVIKNRKKHK